MSPKSFRGARVVHFGEFELDLRAGELRRAEETLRLQEQPYRILTMLLERPGEVVLREEICKRLWPNGTVVEVSHGINAAVLRLREALGESADNPRFVETVARRGYRFRAPVEVECRVPARRETPSGTFNSEELPAGSTLAHFRLEERIGRGGMGVVYRAEDVNLSRPVALKFLAPEMAGDPASVGRFQREARTASALNHPHICTVYAVEECLGQPLIVMELLEGRSLESLLADGPLPAAQALTLVIQMASALETAHAKGIVHRDLKPANIMITRFGVKVLDFGLAKQSPGGYSGARSSVTHSGSIIGTPNYMAPELFQGRKADARSDIYSLGLVLFEMLAGHSVASGQPRELPPSSADLQLLVNRALEPQPENRWQTAGDLKAALEYAVASRVSHPTPPAVTVARLPLWSHLSENGRMAAAAVATALMAFGLVYYKPWTHATSPSEQPMGGRQLISPQGRGLTRPASFPIAGARPSVTGRISLSPDGQSLAYASSGEIYVRRLDGSDVHLAASEMGVAGTPFWSPDGRSLAFTSNGRLCVVPAKGGTPKPLGQVKTTIAGAWGPDGTLLIGEIPGGLMGFPSGGGAERRITNPDGTRGETRHLMPQFLPGGRSYIYTAGSDKAEACTLYGASLDSTTRTAIMPIESGAQFVAAGGTKGYLVFERAGYLMAQAFDAANLVVSGAAVRIAGPVNGTHAASAAAVSIPEFSATPSTLIYHPRTGAGTLFSLISMPGDNASPDDFRNVVVLRDWMKALPH